MQYVFSPPSSLHATKGKKKPNNQKTKTENPHEPKPHTHRGAFEGKLI